MSEPAGSGRIHVNWCPPLQSATRYRIEIPSRDWRAKPTYFRVTRSGHLLAWCARCGRRRRLRNMVILEQAWYDPIWFCRVCPPKHRLKRASARAQRRR